MNVRGRLPIQSFIRVDLPADFLSLLEALTAIGAPTFSEKRRADFILEWLRREVDAPSDQDAMGNVWVDLSSGAGTVRLFDAHTDTVFAHPTVSIRKEPDRWHAPGIYDNTVACAQLMVWAREAAKHSVKPKVLVAFTVGEEGEGNLCGIREIAARFRTRITDAIAFDLDFETLSMTAVGSRRYVLEWTCEGGHSWNDFGRPNAIQLAARWLNRLENAFPWSKGQHSFNAGTIIGGTGVNVIAGRAELRLDVRSIDRDFLRNFSRWLELEFRDENVRILPLGSRPAGAISPDHPLVRELVAAHSELGLNTTFLSLSTNLNALLDAGIPAICTGLARGGGIHTEAEWLDLNSVERGLEKLRKLAPVR